MIDDVTVLVMNVKRKQSSTRTALRKILERRR